MMTMPSNKEQRSKKPTPTLNPFGGVKVMLMLLLSCVVLAVTNVFTFHSTSSKYVRKSISITVRRHYNSTRRGGNDRRFPRTVAITLGGGGNLSSVPYTKKFISSPYNLQQIITANWFESSAKEFAPTYAEDNCEPMHDWQLQSFPNCNMFHELDLQEMRFIAKGGERSAFETRENLYGHVDKFVYKSLNQIGNISPVKLDHQRRDALIMERTSSSQFIANTHGYCGLGIMMDFMPEGSLDDYFQKVRKADGGSNLPPMDRLRITIHIASGVADLHTIDGTAMPSFYHNDIGGRQYLFQDGIYMLNDFNQAKPIYVDKKTNAQCTFAELGKNLKVDDWKERSLEENQYLTGYKGFTPVTPDKIDVWMMGNVMYTAMTDLYPFEKLRSTPESILDAPKIAKAMVAGERSKIPEQIRISDDPSYVAMQKAIDMCWTYSWKERPSARVIADFLMGELRNISGKETPDLRVTSSSW